MKLDNKFFITFALGFVASQIISNTQITFGKKEPSISGYYKKNLGNNSRRTNRNKLPMAF